jgi:hypothetical protein
VLALIACSNHGTASWMALPSDGMEFNGDLAQLPAPTEALNEAEDGAAVDHRLQRFPIAGSLVTNGTRT